MNPSPQTHAFTLTRVIDAPIEAVWRAWTDPDQVMRWWGPTGFTAPLARIDFREGGTSLVCMRAPGGQDFYNNWTYTRIVPRERIEFTNTFADADGQDLVPAQLGLPADIPAAVPHVVTFTALGPNRTELTLTESGYPNPQIAAMSQMGQEQVLDKLAACVI